MYKIKLYKNLFWLNNILKSYYYVKLFSYIIFIDIFYFTNKSLLELKIKIKNENIQSIILNTKILKKIFKYNHYKFNRTKIVMIFSLNLNLFLHIIQFLENIPFYFSYKRGFSSLILNQNIIDWKLMSSVNNYIWGLLIFKFIIYIIVLILYLIYTLIKFLC